MVINPGDNVDKDCDKIGNFLFGLVKNPSGLIADHLAKEVKYTLALADRKKVYEDAINVREMEVCSLLSIQGSPLTLNLYIPEVPSVTVCKTAMFEIVGGAAWELNNNVRIRQDGYTVTKLRKLTTLNHAFFPDNCSQQYRFRLLSTGNPPPSFVGYSNAASESDIGKILPNKPGDTFGTGSEQGVLSKDGYASDMALFAVWYHYTWDWVTPGTGDGGERRGKIALIVEASCCGVWPPVESADQLYWTVNPGLFPYWKTKLYQVSSGYYIGNIDEKICEN